MNLGVKVPDNWYRIPFNIDIVIAHWAFPMFQAEFQYHLIITCLENHSTFSLILENAGVKFKTSRQLFGFIRHAMIAAMTGGVQGPGG